MSFHFSVRDVRGCRHADGRVDPICLIGGPNAQGKTSIAQAVAAALSGTPYPIDGLTKATSGYLVRAGAGEGSVTIWKDAGRVSITWPASSPHQSGKPPQASVWAAGLSSIVNMTARDRTRALAEILRAEPTLDDLRQALPAQAEGIWAEIEQHGFDNAHAVFIDRGRDLKREWQRATGVAYGSRIAASYRTDLVGVDENALAAERTRALDRIGGAIATQAVSKAESERLHFEASRWDELNEAHDRARRKTVECLEALRAAEQARQALPPAEPPQARTAFCPHCGAEVVIEQLSLVEFRLAEAPAPVDRAAVKKRAIAIADADGKKAHATDELNVARKAEAAAAAALEGADTARERIANEPEAIKSGTDIFAAREALSRAERALEEFHVKRRADQLHAAIEANETILTVLAPQGLRATKMQRVLDLFVKRLRGFTDSAGWPAIDITRDMGLTMDGRPYGLLSTSEQYRVRVVLQIGMAELDGSDAVVIDGADVLDGPTRSGLFTLLPATGLCALVCMTATRRGQVPDLAAHGLGRSYWLAGGALEPLEHAEAAA